MRSFEDGSMPSSASFDEFGAYLQDQCSICLEKYCRNNPAMLYQCGHAFHLQCAECWKERQATCPLCWQPLVEAELYTGVERRGSHAAAAATAATRHAVRPLSYPSLRAPADVHVASPLTALDELASPPMPSAPLSPRRPLASALLADVHEEEDDDEDEDMSDCDSSSPLSPHSHDDVQRRYRGPSRRRTSRRRSNAAVTSGSDDESYTHRLQAMSFSSDESIQRGRWTAAIGTKLSNGKCT